MYGSGRRRRRGVRELVLCFTNPVGTGEVWVAVV